MSIEKKNGDIISFLKQKDYGMVNNDLGGGSWRGTRSGHILIFTPDTLVGVRQFLYEGRFDAYQYSS